MQEVFFAHILAHSNNDVVFMDEITQPHASLLSCLVYVKPVIKKENVMHTLW